MSASGRLGCIIWAEFVLTRVGCSEATENIWFTTNDQFYSRKKLFQTWPNDATLSPVSTRALRFNPEVLENTYYRRVTVVFPQ